MCFVLYAGTTRAIVRREFNPEVPDISIVDLKEREAAIRVHFSLPQVQYIGSTSSCGCDFPSITYHNQEWPWFDDGEEDEQRAKEQRNREALVKLLRATGEETVELFGVWDGAFDFATPPAIRETINGNELMDRSFRFKEMGFYVVKF